MLETRVVQERVQKAEARDASHALSYNWTFELARDI